MFFISSLNGSGMLRFWQRIWHKMRRLPWLRQGMERQRLPNELVHAVVQFALIGQCEQLALTSRNCALALFAARRHNKLGRQIEQLRVRLEAAKSEFVEGSRAYGHNLIRGTGAATKWLSAEHCAAELLSIASGQFAATGTYNGAEHTRQCADCCITVSRDSVCIWETALGSRYPYFDQIKVFTALALFPNERCLRVRLAPDTREVLFSRAASALTGPRVWGDRVVSRCWTQIGFRCESDFALRTLLKSLERHGSKSDRCLIKALALPVRCHVFPVVCDVPQISGRAIGGRLSPNSAARRRQGRRAGSPTKRRRPQQQLRAKIKQRCELQRQRCRAEVAQRFECYSAGVLSIGPFAPLPKELRIC